MTTSPLIVALDFPSLEPCRKLLQELEGLVSIYKIGSELFTVQGWKAVELVEKFGGKVFLDLKLHDIPTTVARTSRVIAERGVFMFNVHALGGLEMMREARKARDDQSEFGAKPLLVAVTLLTSLEEKMLSKELGITRNVQEEVLSLAKLAQEAGLDGVVCSPKETLMLRRQLGNDFILVTPGVRSPKDKADDQRRCLTPRKALERGANYLVVGRPITLAEDPRKAAKEVLQSLS